MTTRKIQVGAKTVIIQNVPDNISDEELTQYALMKLMQIGVIKTGQAS